MRLTSISIALLALLCWSCNEKILTGNVDCDECYSEKPENADLVIDLTISSMYPQVPIVVYKGNVEDNEVIYIDTADYSPFYVYVPVGRKYTVKAEYRKGDKALFAIDATKPKAMLVTEACEDGECYVIENETMDARIKSDFLDF